jgi:hypothetical protein
VEGEQKTKTGQKRSPLFRTSQGTWAEHLQDVFQLHPSENEPEEEKALILLQTPPTNSNHQPAISKALEFQKSLAA